MARLDPQVAAHLEWIGFVKPTGLVVSAPALSRAGVILNRRDIGGQQLLNDWADTHQPALTEPARHRDTPKEAFCSFTRQVLGWSFSPKGYAGTAEEPIPAELQIQLPDSDIVFGPDYAVRVAPLTLSVPPSAPTSPAVSSSDEGDGEGSRWQLLVSVTDPGISFDRAATDGSHLSAQGRMERLLRHTRAPAGLLFNGQALRLISAPVGESSGWLDFQIADMRQTAGRPICAAMRELLSETRLLSMPTDKRLAALLHESRKFQNEVSERLAEQVLHALYELLRGFEAAHDASRGELLDRQLREEPDEIYRGLLTVVLRLVFLLYTEERDMLPQDEVFLSAYSVTGLYERLRADAAMHPDTMDQRYGAYAQLLALWRMVHDGAQGPNIELSPRYGNLFDPGRYAFLEGRATTGLARQIHERVNAPHVSDGTVHRVLEKLIVLDAERISYRALDVEHIGSVYETMMGFRLETATGPSIAIRAAKKHGAPATVNIEELLKESPADRSRWLRDRTDRRLTANVSRAVRVVDCNTTGGIEEMHAALEPVIDQNATPDLVPVGAMVLQPSEERRRSGSHYTPRELTEPIVRTALEPVLARLRAAGDVPLRPNQILDLKVCDPAVGSGAFLVEVCRQLAEALIEAWRAHNITPDIPADEDETTFARRLVAQRCLYGVDRNSKAVDLAKLSLWLTTLANEHPLTFLDHAFRHGDSLVGLSIQQLQAFHWKGNAPYFAAGFEALKGREHLNEAAELRQLIRDADDSVTDTELRALWRAADYEISAVRLLGDLVLSAFFEGTNANTREARRKELATDVLNGDAETHRLRLDGLRDADSPLVPFHWEIEFPEVFDRDAPGFDVIVGNPPFLGGRNITATQGGFYSQWLRTLHDGSSGGADLVAHFFRRAHILLRSGGTLGFLATNTISQGDTRATGLRWISSHGGQIYHARRRTQWPGSAAVIVSVVHIVKDSSPVAKFLDGARVDNITAFLFHDGGNNDPIRLKANAHKSFQGTIPLGKGFEFDDADTRGRASSLADMERLVSQESRNSEVIFPYIGGRELNTSPSHLHHRYIIDFGERADKECRAQWPALFEIVEKNVLPERLTKDAKKYPRMVYEWWKYWNARPELYSITAQMNRILAISQTSRTLAFAFLPSGMVYSSKLIIFPFEGYSAFAALQARIHETWVRFFGSTMKDDDVYTPSDCFETFPFPNDWENRSDFESVGKEYCDFRASLMLRNDEGMTKVYNRFHDPYERDSSVLELRELHAAMDRAVFDAYGWTDIATHCEFILDYGSDEDAWGNKKMPYRFRWPDHIRDVVLGRLLKLNAERAEKEAHEGLAAQESPPLRRPRGGRRGLAAGRLVDAETLFDSALNPQDVS